MLFYYVKKRHHLRILVVDVEAGPHDIGRYRAEVKDGNGRAGIEWLRALLPVAVAENATEGLGIANLAPGIEVVLIS